MNILIIGNGGREHALGWKLKQSPQVSKIYFIPGNGGTYELGENVNIKTTDIKTILNFVKQHKIDFTVVGPEDPLSQGIVDIFEKNNCMIFGPTQAAARLESSKSWSAHFMKKYKIPHPVSYTFTSYKKAVAFFSANNPLLFVIKASGLAMGKGVVLPSSKEEAIKALEDIMIKKEYGEAGCEVVIQERLLGREISLLALSDGRNVRSFPAAQDHKRVQDDNKGPNTGGMGTYAPVPFVSKKLMKEIQNTILIPTINGMRQEKHPYKGVLFAGLMITKEGPKVLEYNVRFGDPETQSLMMLLKSDLLSLLLACSQGTLKKKKIIVYKKAAVCVVLASKGYPGVYTKGELIHGLEKISEKNISIFHAGTIEKEGKIYTNGGRVLGAATLENNLKTAIKKIYFIIRKRRVHFAGMHFRNDIGKWAY